MTIRATLPMLAVLLGGGLLFLATDGFRAITTEGARRIGVAENPVPVPDLLLEDMNGRTVSITPVSGETVLVEFIYTSCPIVCQEAAIDFAEIRDRLIASGSRARLVSVSFDPEKDDTKAMSDYGAAHGADGGYWTVARPDASDLNRLLNTFGVTVIPDEWLGYQHNAAIHFIDGQGRLAGIFDTDAIGAVVERVVSADE